MLHNMTMGDLRIRNLSDDLHYKLKVICAKKRISMNQLIKDLIKKYIEENNGK